MKKLFGVFVCIIFISQNIIHAQSIGFWNDNNHSMLFGKYQQPSPNTLLTLDTNGILYFNSNKGGVIVPKLPELNILALANPMQGQLMYASDKNIFYYFNGINWKSILNNDSLGLWEKTISSMYPKSLTVNVGIGTNIPAQKLHVQGNARITNMPTVNSGNAIMLSDISGNLNKISGISVGEFLKWNGSEWQLEKESQALSVTSNVLSLSGSSNQITFSGGSGIAISTAGNDINISNTNILPTATLYQTLYYSGSSWVANSNLLSDGSNVGIGTNNLHERLVLNGVLSLQEIPSPASFIQHNGFGKIYIKSSDSKLYYQNDSGNEFVLNGSGATYIQDSDANTKVQTEKFANEDKIRFDLGGTEHFVMSKNSNGILNLLIHNNKFNTYMGEDAGKNTSSGEQNIGIGYKALQGFVTGTNNIAIGQYALGVNTAGSNNIALGLNTLASIQTGIRNVAMGNNALLNAVSSNNIALGFQAGENLTTGNKNIIIGYNVAFASATESNQLNIGNIIYGKNINGQLNTESTGNIGIGKQNPVNKLDVNGAVGRKGFLQVGFLYSGPITSIINLAFDTASANGDFFDTNVYGYTSNQITFKQKGKYKISYKIVFYDLSNCGAYSSFEVSLNSTLMLKEKHKLIGNTALGGSNVIPRNHCMVESIVSVEANETFILSAERIGGSCGNIRVDGLKSNLIIEKIE